MIVNLITHRACLGHCNPPWHPESPARLEAVEAALSSGPVERGVAHWVEAPRAAREDVLRVHAADHIARFEALDQAGGGALDPDTYLGPGSLEAAWRAAGAAVRAAELALAGGGAAFCPVRPPGHHATPSRAMGFCLFNNAAVAARAALERLGAERVLVVDWDVHHGNGTADAFRTEPRVRYVSLHQWPYYPGTGAEDDTGAGNLFNVPRPPGLPRERYVADLLAAVDRAVTGFVPSLVIVSAGFDALAGDPLGGFTLEPDDYHDLTLAVRRRAGRAAMISVLEGGYDPARLAAAAVRHVEALAS
ncbi:MAG TPA: histone deacetylase [Gemmatimonadales bacterium]|nr:histone deacetylase [Gemmatimonadales bacterium]